MTKKYFMFGILMSAASLLQAGDVKTTPVCGDNSNVQAPQGYYQTEFYQGEDPRNYNDPSRRNDRRDYRNDMNSNYNNSNYNNSNSNDMNKMDRRDYNNDNSSNYSETNRTDRGYMRNDNRDANDNRDYSDVNVRREDRTYREDRTEQRQDDNQGRCPGYGYYDRGQGRDNRGDSSYSSTSTQYSESNYSQTQGYDQRAPYGERQKKFKTESDRDLSKSVYDALSNTFQNRYNNINVQVNNGKVTLQGQVATQGEKDKIEKTVDDVDGVKSIDNQIDVTNSSNMNRNDMNKMDMNR